MLKRGRVGNASTRYCFEPELLESDIAFKLDVYNQFKKDLVSVLFNFYVYGEGQGAMSLSTKRQALLEVHQEFIKFVEGEGK